jgi:hypothetical protein
VFASTLNQFPFMSLVATGACAPATAPHAGKMAAKEIAIKTRRRDAPRILMAFSNRTKSHARFASTGPMHLLAVRTALVGHRIPEEGQALAFLDMEQMQQ